MALTKIGSIGINTGIQLAGVTTAASLKVGTGVTIVSDGDVWVGGAVTIGGNLDVSGDITYDEITGRNLNITGISTFNDDILFKGANAGITSAYWDKSANRLNINDDAKFSVGTGGDLEIYHNSTDSFIVNSTGTLKIRGSVVQIDAPNAEMILQGNADGAVNLYHNGIKVLETHANGVYLKGPEGGDASLYLYADEGDDDQDKWRIVSTTGGELHFESKTSGSWEDCLHLIGNGATELYYDNSKTFETISGGNKVTGHLELNDNGYIRLGTDNDLNFYHDGSVARLYNSTGSIVLRSDDYYFKDSTGNDDIAKFIEDGAVTLYHNAIKKFETYADGVKVFGQEGTSSALQLLADDGDDNGDTWEIRSNQDANDLTFKNNTSGSLVDILTLEKDGDLKLTGDLWCTADNKKVQIGAGADIQIFHDTNNNYLRAYNVPFRIQTNNDENAIVANQNGSVELYHDNTLKIETASDKINFHAHAKVNADNTYDLGASGARWKDLYLSGGLFVGGTGSANELDDYEEGTWTPSITTASGTITVGASFHAEYTKIGRMVYLTARFTISAVSSPSGWLKFGTLPFTADSFGALALTTTGLGDTDDKIPQGLVEYNHTYGYLRTFRDGIESDNISGYFQNGTAIILSTCYNVA